MWAIYLPRDNFQFIGNCSTLISNMRVSPRLTWQWSGCLVVCWSVKLCNSALEQATDKLNTILELGQIGEEDPTIKKSSFSLQEFRMSSMCLKGNIWMARYIFDNL